MSDLVVRLSSNERSSFRDPQSNARYTKSLFLEESYSDKSKVLYTLKDEDHLGYVSLYKRYMEMADPYEIHFAEAYFEGWEHWQMVCSSSWFKPYITRWRKELNLKLRAAALNVIKEISEDKTNRGRLAAAKILLDGGWQDKEEGKGAGRPSKESIRKEADNLFNIEREHKLDLQRIQ